MKEFINGIKRYTDFSGRATRREFWMYQLGYFILFTIVMVISLILVRSRIEIVPVILVCVTMLALLLPTLAISVRRLHDVNKSGWFLLINLIPLGAYYIIYLLVLKGTEGTNKYGD